MIKTVFGSFLTFVGGFVAGTNMAHLLPANNGYEAGWWKVGLATIIAIFGMFVSKEN